MKNKMIQKMLKIMLCGGMFFQYVPAVAAEEYEEETNSDAVEEPVYEETAQNVEEVPSFPEDEETQPEEIAEPEYEESTDTDESVQFDDSTEQFTIENGVLVSYNGSDTVVEIPETVTEIGERAFYGNTDIVSVSFPSELTAIGKSAFQNCTGLTGDLVIPESVTNIGKDAFNGCTGLTGTLTLSSNLKDIPENAFKNVPFTGALNIPEGVETIGVRAFDGNKFSGEVVFPDSLRIIGIYAFTLTYDLENITFGSGLTEFAYYIFNNNDKTEEITFKSLTPPDVRAEYSLNTSSFKSFLGFFPNLKRINVPKESFLAYFDKFSEYLTNGVVFHADFEEEYLIEGTVLRAYLGSDSEVTVPDGITEIGHGAFQNNGTLTKVVLPEGITAIGNNAFSGCENLSEIDLPESLLSIGNFAFASDKHLDSLELPSGLETIEKSAFENCTGLTGNLVIPDSVTSMGINAFNGCSGLTGTLTLSRNLKVIPENAFKNVPFTGSLNIPEGVETIGKRAFDGNKFSGEVVFPDSLKTIEIYAFTLTYNLENITFGSGLTDFAYYIFNENKKTEEITFKSLTPPDIWSEYSINTSVFKSFLGAFPNLKRINIPKESYFAYVEKFSPYLTNGVVFHADFEEDYLIEGTQLLAYFGSDSEVTVPEGVTEIGTGAFQNNGTLTKVVLPEGITAIGNNAFSGCVNLSEIDLPESLLSIGANAFTSDAQLNEIELPTGLKVIGSGAFQNCTGLTGDLVIPDSVTSIGTDAFSGCTGLNGTVTLSSNLKDIPENAFRYVPFTGRLNIPEGVETIGRRSFDGNQFSGDVVFPDSLKKIEIYSFTLTYDLENITFGSGLTEFSYYTFTKNEKTEEITFKSLTPPDVKTEYSINNSRFRSFLEFFPNLKKIYVPKEAYLAYVEKFGAYLTDGVEFVPYGNLLENLKVTELTANSVRLQWDAFEDEQFIKYQIFRSEGNDGEQLVYETTDNWFVDHDLITGNRYIYKIKAVFEDEIDNAEASVVVVPSSVSVVSIRTKYDEDGVPQIRPRQSQLYADVYDQSVTDDPEAVPSGRFWYLDGTGDRVFISDPLTIPYSVSSSGKTYSVNWDVSELPTGMYTVGFTYTPAVDETAELSTEVRYGNEIPQKPSSVYAFGDINCIVLNWSVAHEISTKKYHVYRSTDGEDFELVKVFNSRDTLSWTDTDTEPGQIYYYYVCGVNRYGEEGTASDIVSAVPLSDTVKPQIVKITPADYTSVSGEASFYVQAEDNVGVARTELYYSVTQDENEEDVWEFLAFSDNSYIKATLDTRQFPDGILKVKAVAYDNALPYVDENEHGNESDPMIRNYMIDNTGPSQVKDITWQSTASVITLMWPDVEDQDRKFYRVEQKDEDGSYFVVKDVTALGININGLESDTDYVFRVVCYDQSGNRGIESEDVFTRTAADTTSPVISAFSPAPGNYQGMLNVKVKASDDKTIAKIIVQTSRNAETWNNYQTFTYKGTNKEETASFTLNLDSLSDGYLYVRGIAADSAGNTSDESNSAPYVQYCIYHTAPGVPQNVTADTTQHAIEIRWDLPVDNDIAGFVVYRSENGTDYELLKDDVTSLKWFDRTAVLGKLYSYKVAAKDTSGNISELSEPAEASLSDDTEAPVIESIKPADGSVLGSGSYTVSVLASDNYQLASVKGTYRKDGSEEEKPLFNEQISDTYYQVVSGDVDISAFDDQDSVTITVTVEDAVGLTVTRQYHYTIDKIAPNVMNLTVDYLADHISLSWSGEQEEDLQGYRICRSDDSSEFRQIYALAANDSNQYSYDDYAVSNTVSYQYKIEAVDMAGNTSDVISNTAYLSGESIVSARLIYTPVQEVDTDYIYDASECVSSAQLTSYTFDFGDGTEISQASPSAVHRYTATGEYTVTLTIRDETGSEDVITKTITVKEASLFGTLKVHVIDFNGNPQSNAAVYFDLANEDGIKASTDRNGDAIFHAEAGIYEVGAYITNKVPAKTTVSISAGRETSVSLRMSDTPLVTGNFNITRMTLDEIKAAGIDISDPANQQIIKYEFFIRYGDDPPVNCTMYGEPEKEVRDTFHVGGGGSNVNAQISYNPKTKVLAILVLPAQTSWLKEFFDVRLHIFNNASSDFMITNSTASLVVPEGLTVMKTEVTEGNPSALYGQEQLTYSFVVRGDKEGSYAVSADYSGTLMPFNSAVFSHFDSTEKIHVNGESAVEVGGNFDPAIKNGTAYFELYVKNTSSADIYYPVTSPIFNFGLWIREKKDEDGFESSETETTLIASRIVSSNGISQNLDIDYLPDMLAPGESYVRKYALYGMADIDEEYYINLIHSTARNLDGYGGTVKINILQEIINHADDSKKIERILNDDNYASLYSYFMSNKNFYSAAYTEGTSSSLYDFNDNIYKASKLLSWDFEIFTNDGLEDKVRNLVYQYIQSDQCKKDSEKIFDTEKMKIITKTTTAVSSLLPREASDDSDEIILMNMLSDYLNSANNAEELVKVFDKEGSAGIGTHLIVIAADIAAKNDLEVDYPKIKQKLEMIPYNQICGDSMTDTLKFVNKSISLEKQFMDMVNTSNEYGIQMTALHAQKESALAYIDKIIAYHEKNPQPYGQRVLDAYKQVRKEIDSDYDEYAASFTYEACQQVLKYGGKKLTSKVIPGILEAADKKAIESMRSRYFIPDNLTPGTVSWASAFKTGLAIAKTTFTVMYALLGTKDYVDLRELMSVNNDAINAGVDSIKSLINTDPEAAWLELQELIRLRIETEAAYFQAVKKTDNDEEFLKNYNELNGTSYTDIDTFVSDYIGNLQKMSDQLSSEVTDTEDVSGGVVRPEAPAVSIDFAAETTIESFDEAFEYSFNNSTWTTCSGDPIPLYPDRNSKMLFVRAKATANSLEGYTAVLFIPAKKSVHITCRAVWNDGALYLTNLGKGKYTINHSEQINVENGPDDIFTLQMEHSNTVTVQMISTDAEFSRYSTPITVEDPIDISIYDSRAYLEQSDFSYDGTEKTPALLFKGTVPENMTWESSYTDNVEAGTAEAVFTGTGLYTGTITRQFVIVDPKDIIKAKKLTLSKSKVTLTVRSEASENQTSTVTLEPKFSPASTNIRNLTWTSSNPEVAYVTAGTVTGLSAGKAVITAKTENGIKAVCNVTVVHGEGLASDGLYYDSKGKLVSGWKTITVNGKDEIVYLTKGKPAVGWNKINKKYYCFNDDGYLITGWVNNRTSWLDPNPDPKKNKGMLTGWQQLNGNWYYFDKNGIKATGLTKISNQYYYFSESADPELSGIMQSGWQQVGDAVCYFAESAKNKHAYRRTGWLSLPDPETGETFRYYFDSVKGGLVRGLIKISSKLYYFDEYGHLAEEPVLQSPEGDYRIDSKGRMADAAGKLAQGLLEINGKIYYFKKGVIQTGWQKIIDEAGKAVYYFFNQDGTLEEGKTGGEILDDGKKTWFIEESGVRSVETGLVQDSEGHTYAIKNGQILYGEQKVQIAVENGKPVYSYYYFDKETGWMLTNVLRCVKNKWYFYDTDGTRSTEPLPIEISGEDYLLNQNGTVTDLSGTLLNTTGTVWIKYMVTDPEGNESNEFDLFYLKKGKLSVKWQSIKVANPVEENKKQTYTTYKVYGDPETGILLRGIKTISKKMYYFSKSGYGSLPIGRVVKGFFTLPGRDGVRYTYWADKNGVLATGWKQINKVWYCFSSEDGHLTETK